MSCEALVITGPTGPTGPAQPGPTGPTGPGLTGHITYGGSVSIASSQNATVEWPEFPNGLLSFIVNGVNFAGAYDSLTASSAKVYNTFGSTQVFQWVAVGH